MAHLNLRIEDWELFTVVEISRRSVKIKFNRHLELDPDVYELSEGDVMAVSSLDLNSTLLRKDQIPDQIIDLARKLK
jgi:hypothetical protein